MKTRQSNHQPSRRKTPPSLRRKYVPEFDPVDLASRDMLTTAEAPWVLHIGDSLSYKLILTPDAATGKPALHSAKVGR